MEQDKILVIPDVHLRGWMFDEADRLMKENEITQAVCLGDLVDDWNQELNYEAYEKVFEKVFEFDEKHPNTLWCYGNHDVSYLWRRLETGYSPYQEETVVRNILKMRKNMEERLAFAHSIGKCLFTHAGVTWEFLDELRYRGFQVKGISSIEDVRDMVNQCMEIELWRDSSPIWARPTCEGSFRVFSEYGVFQVTGHTPVGLNYLNQDKTMMFCDNFSTYQDGRPIGPEKFPVVTPEGEWVDDLWTKGRLYHNENSKYQEDTGTA